jgi:predicted nucleic acid-binding protein
MSSTRTERYTLDTNVLIYTMDRSAGAKHKLAIEIVDRSIERACVLTLQALAEFTRCGHDWLVAFQVVAADTDALNIAYTATLAGAFGLFDALLLATARRAGCTIALSEDMGEGAVLGGITVRNPFQGEALPDGLRPLLGLP